MLCMTDVELRIQNASLSDLTFIQGQKSGSLLQSFLKTSLEYIKKNYNALLKK